MRPRRLNRVVACREALWRQRLGAWMLRLNQAEAQAARLHRDAPPLPAAAAALWHRYAHVRLERLEQLAEDVRKARRGIAAVRGRLRSIRAMERAVGRWQARQAAARATAMERRAAIDLEAWTGAAHTLRRKQSANASS